MPDKVTMEEQAYLDGVRRRLQAAARWLDQVLSEEDNMGYSVLSVTISGPNKTGGEFKVVAKVRGDDGKGYYAIVSGADTASVLAQLKQVAESKGLPLREDTPYKG